MCNNHAVILTRHLRARCSDYKRTNSLLSSHSLSLRASDCFYIQALVGVFKKASSTMDLKISVFLLLTVLGVAAYHAQAAGQCDWPRGTCTYYKDPCPPNWERCPQYDKDCPVATNHCCCRKNPPPPPPPPPPAKKCDWPRGTCTYYKDPCPPNWERCPQYDSSCPLATNHCCCRKNVETVPQLPLLKPTQEEGDARRCDWPKGVCTYINDPCPPSMRPCGNYYCPLGTNRCCCRQ